MGDSGVTGPAGNERLPSALVDGGLAAFVLTILVFAGRRRGGRLRPAWLVLGGVVTVCSEAVLSRHERTVRSVWERPAVRLGTTLAAAMVGAVWVRRAPDTPLSLGVGGLVTYLFLLFGVTVGVVSPPRTWTNDGGK
jgi:hypothetical protein